MEERRARRRTDRARSRRATRMRAVVVVVPARRLQWSHHPCHQHGHQCGRRPRRPRPRRQIDHQTGLRRHRHRLWMHRDATWWRAVPEVCRCRTLPSSVMQRRCFATSRAVPRDTSQLGFYDVMTPMGFLGGGTARNYMRRHRRHPHRRRRRRLCLNQWTLPPWPCFHHPAHQLLHLRMMAAAAV